MATDRTVTGTAADGFKHMTLGELEDFIAEMHEAGAARTTPISARVTFGGWLKQVKATAIRTGDRD